MEKLRKTDKIFIKDVITNIMHIVLLKLCIYRAPYYTHLQGPEHLKLLMQVQCNVETSSRPAFPVICSGWLFRYYVGNMGRPVRDDVGNILFSVVFWSNLGALWSLHSDVIRNQAECSWLQNTRVCK